MRLLAQAEDVSIWDNKILDEWVLPFGQWVDQMVDWIDQNMSGPLAVIRWPFTFLIENVVVNFIADVSWIWVCLAFRWLGASTRLSLIRSPRSLPATRPLHPRTWGWIR